MSDEERRADLVVGRVELPEVITIAEQAKAAGRNEVRRGTDDIDEFRSHCVAFLNAQGAGDPLSMARTKMDEMIFWLRRHRERAV